MLLTAVILWLSQIRFLRFLIGSATVTQMEFTGITLTQNRAAILIPFRQSMDNRSQGINRETNLKEWLHYMDWFLFTTKAIVTVLIIEQTQGGLFNKGALFNIGYNLVKNSSDYMILHDVDQVPSHKGNNYDFRLRPTKLIAVTTRMKGGNNGTSTVRPLDVNNVGGALMITPGAFSAVNGYSNKFGGWGREDDNMAFRLRTVIGGYDVLNNTIGAYRELYHGRVWGLDNTPQFKRNVANARDLTSGLSNLRFLIEDWVEQPTVFKAMSKLTVRRVRVEVLKEDNGRSKTL